MHTTMIRTRLPQTLLPVHQPLQVERHCIQKENIKQEHGPSAYSSPTPSILNTRMRNQKTTSQSDTTCGLRAFTSKQDLTSTSNNSCNDSRSMQFHIWNAKVYAPKRRHLSIVLSELLVPVTRKRQMMINTTYLPNHGKEQHQWWWEVWNAWGLYAGVLAVFGMHQYKSCSILTCVLLPVYILPINLVLLVYPGLELCLEL